jgi:hypothetical protein
MAAGMTEDVKDGNGIAQKMLAAQDALGNNAIAHTLVDENGVPVNNGSRVNPEDTVNIHLLDAGAENMAVDGSITPVVFKYTVPALKVFELWRMMIYLDDSVAFAATTFGGVAGPLANGVEIDANGTLLETWIDNSEIALTMHDFIGYKNLAKEDRSGAGRWSFDRSFGGPLKLDAGEVFSITVNDDLTGLDTFHAKIQGKLFDV